MRIAMITSARFDANQGVSGSVLALGEAMRYQGAQVEQWFMNDLQMFSGGRTDNLLFPWRLALHRVVRQKYDVLDISAGDAWIVAFLPRRSLLVVRSHGLEHVVHLEQLEEARRGNRRLSWKYPLYRGGFHLWEVATSLRRADLALFLNRYDLEYATKKLNVRPERARIVANGIPEGFLNLPFEGTPIAQDTPVRIAQVGSYIARKGVKYAAPAVNAILARHPWAHMTFLGTGCSADQVLADYEPSVRSRIKVVPRYVHAELPALLQGHHIKLFPTLSEGFGKALIEAMACALAPVVTSTPGPLEIVRDGHDALIIPARSSRAVEQALEQLLTDRALLDRLRMNAYVRAQEYSWNCTARKRLRLYEEFSQGRRSGA